MYWLSVAPPSKSDHQDDYIIWKNIPLAQVLQVLFLGWEVKVYLL